MKEQLDVCIYARVSKEIEDSKDIRYQEPDNQIKPLKEFCKSMNWNVKFVFIDRKSGKDSNRPEFKKMLLEARQHHFDLLLVWSLDRFSREPVINTLAYLQQLKDHSIYLKSYTEGIDTREMVDTQELIMLILMWQSQNERKKISIRTKAGLQASKKKHLIGKRGKDNKPRRRRSDRGVKRGANKITKEKSYKADI